MAQTGIQTVRPHHNAIMDYILANPKARRRDVAVEFGVSESWLSQIINSDCFQNLLAQKQGEFFAEAIVPLGEKITALAHISVDRMLEIAPFMGDTKEIRDNAQMCLKALGYTAPQGQAPAPGVQVNVQNNYQVSPEVLRQARAKIGNTNGEKRIGPSEGLQASGPNLNGGDNGLPASIREQTSQTLPGETTGHLVREESANEVGE